MHQKENKQGIIIPLGPPNAGKGTQCKKICEKYGFIHISTGELLRAEVAAQTPLGIEIEKVMNAGKLVEDVHVFAVLEKKFDTHPEASGFMLDGFPRSEEQVVMLLQLMEKRGMQIVGLLELIVSDEELEKQRQDRVANATQPRPDDDPETFLNRLNDYKKYSKTVKDKFAEYSIVCHLIPHGTKQEVFLCIESVLALKTQESVN